MSRGSMAPTLSRLSQETSVGQGSVKISNFNILEWTGQSDWTQMRYALFPNLKENCQQFEMDLLFYLLYALSLVG